MAQVAATPRPPSRSSIRSPSPLQQSFRPPGSIRPPSHSSSQSRTQNDASSASQMTSPTFSRQDMDLASPPRPPRSSRRKSSYESLVQMAGNKDGVHDSQIPLPARTFSAPDTSIEAIQEGIPLEISVKSPGTPNGDGRPLTPTRTISRAYSCASLALAPGVTCSYRPND